MNGLEKPLGRGARGLRSHRRSIAAVRLILASIVIACSVSAQELDDLLEISLSDLVEMDVTLASGIPESILDAPAAIVVISAEEIRQRGYTNLAEIVEDLPGFDTVHANGIPYLYAYQRGYRQPSTQRTLLMIDGQVDNRLWTHQAVFTRRFPVSSIKRMEILYGPASAVHGANAFLGVINIITDDGQQVEEGEYVSSVNFHTGSYDSKGIDAAVRGKISEVSYSLSGRMFKSDEPDLSGRFGFLDPAQYGDPAVWGPLLDLQNNGRHFGTYYDPTDDSGVLGSLSYRGAKVGFVRWIRKEGYGAQYTADHVQNNSLWNTSGSLIYTEADQRLSDRMRSSSLLSFRKNRAWGSWPEAFPDGPDSSYVSFTQWNSVSNSWLFKQRLEVAADDLIQGLAIMGGFKFERKELTQNYDIPGYWGAFSSTVPANEPGPYGFGAGIGHSRDATYTPPPLPNPEMPPINLLHTEDIGGFVQGIWDRSPWRFNAGVRFDHNSVYGRSVNPRLSFVYKLSQRGALKLVYGEAFKEPAPIQLWGGFSGRNANPDLEPEKARNTELIAMYQTGHIFHDASVFYSHYEDVIKEEALNAGTRDIWGMEYRGRFAAPNLLTSGPQITGFFYYTFTDVTSSTRYNHGLDENGNVIGWEDGDTELGDIAPHKINTGVNLPFDRRWNVNLRSNFVGRRKLYSQNPLRAQGETIDPYIVFNGVLSYSFHPFRVTAKVLNMLDADFFHPGVEQADSGNSFDERSLGFRNSLIPQPGRSYVLAFSIDY